MISLNFSKIVVASLIVHAAAYAGFQSPNINLSMKTLSLDDTIVADQSCTLTCKESFEGKGSIKSRRISITTKKFQFTGTIECDGDCFITAKHSFNQKMFKRKGRGKFYITIDPKLTFNEEKKTFAPLYEPRAETSLIREASIPKLTIEPEDLKVSKEISIEGSTFTVEGSHHIAIAEAIQQGSLDTVKELLEKYSAIQNSKRQLSVFMVMAGLSGHTAIAEECIRRGADVNDCDQDAGDRWFSRFSSQKHLITAVIAKKADFVALLVKEGADPNVKNRDNISALMIAVLQNDLATVKALLQSPKINLDERNISHGTPLIRAAYDGNLAMVQALVDAGANKEACIPGGYTAADIARSKGHDAIALLLLKKTPVVEENLTRISEEKKAPTA